MTDDPMTTVNPIVTERSCGGWLAVSHPDAPYRMGVTGMSEWEARERYSVAYLRWSLILTEPEEGSANG